MPDSPTQTLAPAEPLPRPDQHTATLIPREESRDRTATHTPGEEPVHHTRPLEGPDSPTDFPTPDDRYSVLTFIARGGMGEVWVARDRVLNRDVAVKILRDDLKDRSFVASRFIEEARITGKLEHPGIPPIHDLGTFRDGRPFIAMKLLKDGRTLSDRLAHERPDLGELLRIFEDVCQAVAAAHDRRVIHRDLKPGNVMVGRFNEVQVMDWGLAKVLGEASNAPETPKIDDHASRAPVSVIESDRDPSSHTRAGSLLGTPAYMPPEQAKGEIDRTDRRSDVFALGAMLCELLTGLPPYWAATSAEIQAFALTAQLGPALERLDGSGADSELIALAKHCLKPNPDERPADAKYVAKAIASYRAGVEDRLRKSERERAAAEARAAEEVNTRREAEARADEHRKRRHVQMALILAAFLLAFGAGAAAWWQERQSEERERVDRDNRAERERVQAEGQVRRDRTTEAIGGLLTQVEAALRDDDADKAAIPFALVEKRQAEDGAEALASRIARCRADLAMLRDLEAVTDPITATTYKNLRVDEAFSRAFANYGIRHETTPLPEAVRIISESPLRERLIYSLDLWHLYYEKSRRPRSLRAILDAVDPDPFRTMCRNCFVRGDRAESETLVAMPEFTRQPARFAAILGQSSKFVSEGRERALLAALERSPNNFLLLHAITVVFETRTAFRSEGLTQQFRWAQAAIAVRPNSKVAWRHLGRAFWDKGQLDDAVRCYRKAVRLDLNDAASLLDLSAALLRKHDPEAALAAIQRAIALDPASSNAHHTLGLVLDRMNRHDEAMSEYEKAIAMAAKDGAPYAAYYNSRGYARLRRGDYDRAIADFQEALFLSADYRLAESNLAYAREMRSGQREPEIAPPPRAK